MKELSPLAWAAIAVIGLLALGLYGWLFSLLRSKGNSKDSLDALKPVSRAMFNPWEKEDQQFSELSKRVKDLQEKKEKDQP